MKPYIGYWTNDDKKHFIYALVVQERPVKAFILRQCKCNNYEYGKIKRPLEKLTRYKGSYLNSMKGENG